MSLKERENRINDMVGRLLSEATKGKSMFDPRHPANRIELGYDKNLRYGDDFAKKGGNFMVIRNGQPYYVSRNTSVSLYLFAKNKDGEWCVLANQRGHGSSKGLFNVTCGFVDMSPMGKPQETLEQAACRETFEENGVKINPSRLVMLGVNSKNANINVSFYAVIEDRTTEQMKTSTANAESGEVLQSLWIPLSDLQSYRFAYNQNAKIPAIASKAIGDFSGNGGIRLNNLVAMLRNRLGSDQESQHLLTQILSELSK